MPEIGAELQAMFEGQQYPARVISRARGRVKIHYPGWKAQWDEWIENGSPRLVWPTVDGKVDGQPAQHGGDQVNEVYAGKTHVNVRAQWPPDIERHGDAAMCNWYDAVVYRATRGSDGSLFYSLRYADGDKHPAVPAALVNFRGEEQSQRNDGTATEVELVPMARGETAAAASAAQLVMPNIGEDSSCTICLEEFASMDNKAPVILLSRCGHTFCAKCIEQWWNEAGKSCPTCRVQYSGLRHCKELRASDFVARVSRSDQGTHDSDNVIKLSPVDNASQLRRKEVHNHKRPVHINSQEQSVLEDQAATGRKQRQQKRQMQLLATEKRTQELAQRKASLKRIWNTAKLGACQEECRRRGIWPGGNKSELADRIARAECKEKMSRSERVCITKEELEMLQTRDRKYMIAKVLKHRVANGRDEFLVRWRSHTPLDQIDDTWEPRSCFAEDYSKLSKWDAQSVDELAASAPQASCQPGSVLRAVPASASNRLWKRSGHGWLGRVIMQPHLRLHSKKRRRTSSEMDQRWLVVAWSAATAGVNDAEPLWRLVNEETDEEIDMLEDQMIAAIVRIRYGACSIVEYGNVGPLEEDFDRTDGEWLLFGSKWLGRRLKRTFRLREYVGRVVAFKPKKRGYVAVRIPISPDQF